MADDGTRYTYAELGDVLIVNERIYDHKTLRINFATYDMRRDYDIVNPKKHANVMAVSPGFDPTLNQSEDGHPFVYARVLGIYHADVVYTISSSGISQAHTMEFLFVQWYQRDTSYNAGFLHRRLHRLSLCDANLDASFGFLDPDDIIWGCHLIPAFACGRAAANVTTPDSDIVADPPEAIYDWRYYYVNL